MKKTNKASKIALGFSAAMLLLSTNANAEGLKELESKKSQLQQQVSESANKKATLENQLHKIEAEIKVLEEELNSLIALISKTNSEIAAKEKSIKIIQNEIEETKKIIKEKELDLEKKKAQIEQNLKMMYSHGDVQFLEFLFRSGSISQFLFRYENYKKITDEGEKLHNEVLEQLRFIKEQKELLEQKQAKLVTEKQELAEKKKEQELQKAEQERIQSQLNKKREQIKEDIHDEEEAMKTLGQLITNAERAISSEKGRISEAKRKAEEERKKRIQKAAPSTLSDTSSNNSNKNSSSRSTSTKDPGVSSGLGSGTLGKPMKPGTYTITSGYGYRTHPISGARRLHNGVDFGAPRNTPIYAMEDGFVLFAGPARGYGQWIVIKHDNGLYTIYGHMYSDGVYVKPGQYVFRGQKIGGVGSNGESTGNHLHFCVATSFSGGVFKYANPMNYIN